MLKSFLKKSSTNSQSTLCLLLMIMSKSIICEYFSEEIPFPISYILAASTYELKNTRESLRIMYKLLSEVELQMKNKSSKNALEGFGINNDQHKNNNNLIDFGNDDDFGVFEKLKSPEEKNNINFNVNDSDEIKNKSLKLLRKEQSELFGLFPPKDKLESKYIMLCFEITRIH